MLTFSKGPSGAVARQRRRASHQPGHHTHIDHDHIGAARLLLSDLYLSLTFGDIWFNAPTQAATRGVAEGWSLVSILEAREAELPWNFAWGGEPAAASGTVPFFKFFTFSRST